ncbi:zinc finger protein 670-like [Ruditapes philippinarum]|uniref:zinc finger protein 670-like n=1 Tax=Ruditapes philippinarum TaxID=129788 RepID=UPI00295BA16B|nr:zinc finger protein 670-like [Ruditapes philippinarum]
MADNTSVCSQCGKGFKYKRNLRTHERGHSGTLPFTCCGKGFASSLELESHRCSVHGETKKFVCKTCGRDFARAQTLALHEAREARNEMCTCDVCGHKAVTKDDLKVHLATHSEDRRHGCHVCGKRYKHSSSVYKHVKKTHNTDQNNN